MERLPTVLNLICIYGPLHRQEALAQTADGRRWACVSHARQCSRPCITSAGSRGRPRDCMANPSSHLPCTLDLQYLISIDTIYLTTKCMHCISFITTLFIPASTTD